MRLETIERINGSDGMLPNIADDIVKVAIFEQVDRVGRHPIFHIDVADLSMLPFSVILRKVAPNRIVLILSGQSIVFPLFH